MSRRTKRSKGSNGSNGTAAPTGLDAELADGGLAVYAGDGITGDTSELFHLVPHDLADSLRFFVSRMQPADWGGDVHTLAITSALAGEGVTSIARSLAAILANDLDRTVCLVETNWWDARPAINGAAVNGADIIGADIIGNGNGRLGGPGLGGVLAGTCTIDDTLLHTSDDRLVVLTAGELAPGLRPAAVSSGAFHDVVDSLAKDYDTVIIDVPPVLQRSEATVIAREANSTVLVVHRGVTTEQQVQTAIEELEGGHVLGVIVNRASARVPKFFRRLGLPL